MGLPQWQTHLTVPRWKRRTWPKNMTCMASHPSLRLVLCDTVVNYLVKWNVTSSQQFQICYTAVANINLQVNCTFPMNITLSNLRVLRLCYVTDGEFHCHVDTAGQYFIDIKREMLTMNDPRVKQTFIGKEMFLDVNQVREKISQPKISQIRLHLWSPI